MPRLNKLIQGSPDWHEYRSNHIMATDAATILGINPWKTAQILWEEKLGFSPPTPLNDAMKRGQELEPVARQLYIDDSGVHFEPCVYQCDEYPWMAASLDGIDDYDSIILEIKCPGADTHNFAINGDIKPYYHCQMQHQMMVTRTKLAIYVSLRPECLQNPFVILEVQADEGYQKILYEAEEHFWTQLNTFQKPQHWIFNNEDK